MLKKVFIILNLISVLMAISINVNATSESINIEKSITDHISFESETGGEIVFEISNIDLNNKCTYKYQLKYNETESQWYEISEIDFENGTVKIILEKAKTDIVSILNITDTAYLTIKEINVDSNEKMILENEEIDVSLPLSKSFKVNHNVNKSGFHEIKNVYNIENILFQYVKVSDENIIDKYLEHLENYNSSEVKVYWGYYMDSLIDTLNLKEQIPTDGWRKLPENGITDIQPEVKGLYFIWMKVPETTTNKEMIGCAFSKRFTDVSELEELTATIKYDPTTETTENVTVTITTNKKVNNVDGWTLSEDQMTLTKVYSSNTTESVHLIDIYGYTKDVIIEINNIVDNETQDETGGETEDKTEDKTIINDIFPNAGINRGIIFGFVVLIIISILGVRKYIMYKDIK